MFVKPSEAGNLVPPLYLAVPLRFDPPPPLELPPPQPAIAAAAIRKNARPAYAYCFRLVAGFAASTRLSIAKTAATQARKANGVLRGRISMIPGGSEEIAVVRVAVQEAPALFVAFGVCAFGKSFNALPPSSRLIVPVGQTKFTAPVFRFWQGVVFAFSTSTRRV